MIFSSHDISYFVNEPSSIKDAYIVDPQGQISMPMKGNNKLGKQTKINENEAPWGLLEP
jgi:hypothetical protein